MIILITGPSHVGKTMLAQRLMEKISIPYVSIDHIKMGLIRSNQTDLTPLDDDKLTEYLWPIIREMIKTAIENDQNLIVEGCYIPFDWRKDFDENYLLAIRYICLAMTDSYIENHFQDILAYSSVIEKRIDDSYMTLENVKADHRKYIERYEQVTIIEQNYEKAIHEVINTFSKK